jgi:hypothetical protein
MRQDQKTKTGASVSQIEVLSIVGPLRLPSLPTSTHRLAQAPSRLASHCLPVIAANFVKLLPTD